MNRHHLLHGAAWGTLLALTFSGLLVLLLLVQALAGWLFGYRPPDEIALLPVAPLVLAYLLGGVTAGVVFGVLYRASQTARKSILVGFLISVPFVTAVRLGMRGLTGLAFADLLGIVERALVSGIVIGLGLWAWGRALPAPEDGT